jgi:large subunit ribosomal protein L21
MYAIIKTGGKQYTVRENQVVQVELLAGEVGGTIELNEVLMVKDGERVEIGRPLVAGARVEAEITARGRGPKIRIVKFRRRKHYRKETGHRQGFSALKIKAIHWSGNASI